MRVRRLMSIVAFVLLAGAGCVSESPSPSSDVRPPEHEMTEAAWKEIGDGAARIAVDLNATTTAVLYRFSPERYEIDLVADSPARRVSAWRAARPDAVLAVNAAYFHEDGTPSGFVAVDGTRTGTRAFDLDKSGLVVLKPEFRIIDTARERADLTAVQEGFQSFPFFYSGGRPAISRDSGLEARRTFIGTDEEGLLYVGIVADGEISLYGLMRALAEKTDIRWQQVLNLDGGPSTGLAARFDGWKETMDSFTPVPNVLVVQARRR